MEGSMAPCSQTWYLRDLHPDLKADGREVAESSMSWSAGSRKRETLILSSVSKSLKPTHSDTLPPTRSYLLIVLNSVSPWPNFYI